MQKKCYFGCNPNGKQRIHHYFQETEKQNQFVSLNMWCYLISNISFPTSIMTRPLHSFPLLDYPHEERFEMWKSVLNEEIKSKGNLYIHKNVRLCGRHFEDKYKTRGNRLTANSYPTLYLSMEQEPLASSVMPTTSAEVQPQSTLNFLIGARDTTKLCRSCMKEVASWEKENFDVQAVEMFCFCTNIEITEEDKLPKQFCCDCIIKIESSYTFIKEAQNVNVTLKNIVSRTETNIYVDLENCSRITESFIEPKSHLKLTLPDYKLCSSIGHSVKNTVLHNIDKISYDILDDNVSNNTVTHFPKEQPLEPKEPKINNAKETKISDSDKKNVCLICRKGFMSKVWFAKHMEKEHNGKKYTCTDCDKTFSKSSQLVSHTATHSNECKFACNLCNKQFKRRKQLTVHSRSHSDEQPYSCDKCQKRFKLKSLLKCHMKVHEGNKQYLCSYCGWAFTQSSNLSAHIRRHTGDRPHACAECGYRAFSTVALRRHARRHSAAPPPLLCAHCSKRCHDRSALARHQRTHTGERPYRCPSCPRAFADSWKRKTHLMRAHNLTLQDIPRLRRDGLPLLPTPA